MTLNKKLQIAKEALGRSFPETRISDPAGPDDLHPEFYSIKVDEFDPSRYFVARIHIEFLTDRDEQAIERDLERFRVAELMKANANRAVEVWKSEARLGID